MNQTGFSPAKEKFSRSFPFFSFIEHALEEMNDTEALSGHPTRPSAIDNCCQQALLKPFGLPGSQAAGVAAALLGELEIFPMLGMFPATPGQFARVLSFYSGVTLNNLSSPCLPPSVSYGGVNPQPWLFN